MNDAQHVSEDWIITVNSWRGQSLKAIICKLGFGATVFEIWNSGMLCCFKVVLVLNSVVTSIKKVKMRAECESSNSVKIPLNV